MLHYLDYVQQAFFAASRWDRDNSYGALTATPRALLDFPTPNGLTLNFSSLASPNFATSYSLANTGTVDGSLAYLFSSLALPIASKSHEIPLRRLIPGYRHLRNELDEWQASPQQPVVGKSLLYGRLYLPASHLEALYLRRISAKTQLKIQAVSQAQLKSGGSVLFLLSRDYGKYSTEWLYSTDSALLGLRGLYNFGPDIGEDGTSETSKVGADSATVSKTGTAAAAEGQTSPISRIGPAPLNGRFSAGAELYYGLLNKSGGISTGVRFATLPRHPGFPYTMTLTLNPLMGNLSGTYSVRAGPALALAARFDFNFYSYESGYHLGLELWRKRARHASADDIEWARRKLRLPGKGGWGEPRLRVEGDEGSVELRESRRKGVGLSEDPYTLFDNPTGFEHDEAAGVLKARVNQEGRFGLIWEGRVKELLYSAGVSVDFRRKEQIFRGVGVEVSYSS